MKAVVGEFYRLERLDALYLGKTVESELLPAGIVNAAIKFKVYEEHSFLIKGNGVIALVGMDKEPEPVNNSEELTYDGYLRSFFYHRNGGFGNAQRFNELEKIINNKMEEVTA